MASPLGSIRGLWGATTPADRFVSIGLLLLSFVLAAGLRAIAPRPDLARVTFGETEDTVLPLAQDRRLVVPGRLGPVVVVVETGGVRIAESGCAHHLCLAMGVKRRAGEMVACVPNGVVVRLEGSAEDPTVPDAVTR